MYIPYIYCNNRKRWPT